MKITVFSHFFAVTDYRRDGYEYVKNFAREFAEYDYRAFFMAKKYGGGKAKPELKRIYASYSENKHEFRFHVHKLKDFIKLLDENYFKYKIEYMGLFDFGKTDYKIADWFVPREDQVPHIDYMLSEGRTKMLNLPPGAGKLQRVTEPVLTPTGWRPIGELKVGDVVCTPDGGTANVTGVFPQGEKLQYKVVFQDGRFTHAGEEHLWTMYDHEWSVGTTGRMIQSLKDNPDQSIFIPLAKAWAGIETELDSEPYAVGMQAADDNTSIPLAYLDAPVRERRVLLAGILENINLDDIKSKELADDLCYLIRSLQGIASVIDNGTSENPSYSVKRTQSDKLQVIDIIPEDVEQSVCIMIDHPQHLYITKDFIVTHNTATSLYSCAKMGGKIFISLETRFFNIWRDALLPGKKQVLELKTEEVMFVQGTKDLQALIELGILNALEEVKVFVVASRTLGLFIEAYERSNGDLGGLYGCNPEDLYEIIKTPLKIKDEVHLGLHANFKEVVNTHLHKYIALSGTLEDGSFRDKIFAILFPKEIRSPDTEYMKYIEVTALMYSLTNSKKIKTSHRGMTDYSHNAFEQSILKDNKLYKNYRAIVSMWLKDIFLTERQKGMRAAIFVESIELATRIHKDLTNQFKELSFGRYCASTGDKYQEARQADVLITTVKSFGTGFDMEDLYCAFMTNAIKSQNTNIQVLFRLRQLKNFPGIFPKFHYLVCSDIPKHMEYHEAKKLQFEGKVKKHITKFLSLEL